jgi:DNA-binding response OmpR family regulator
MDAGSDCAYGPSTHIDNIVARIRAFQRRGPTVLLKDIEALTDRLSVDFKRNKLLIDGNVLPIPVQQFRFLSVLVRERGTIVSASDIVMRSGFKSRDSNVLDVQISQLRKKIDAVCGDGYGMQVLVTHRALGFSIPTYEELQNLTSSPDARTARLTPTGRAVSPTNPLSPPTLAF